MSWTITDEKWQAARTGVRTASDRFAAMLAGVHQTGGQAAESRPAVGHWSVTETAAHVGSVAWMYTFLLRPGGRARLPFSDLDEQLWVTTVDGVADLNVVAMRHFSERDPAKLVDQFRRDIAEILEMTEGRDPNELVPWLGDSRVPVAGALAHLINELLIHGWDIARALRTPWTIPPEQAALFIELFLFGMMRNDVGSLLDTGKPQRDRRIAVRFRSRYTTPTTVVLRGGEVSVEDPGGPVDVKVSFDPAMLNLMLFGRVGKVRSALTGKVIVSGRRPWLLPEFLKTVRMPP